MVGGWECWRASERVLLRLFVSVHYGSIGSSRQFQRQIPFRNRQSLSTHTIRQSDECLDSPSCGVDVQSGFVPELSPCHVRRRAPLVPRLSLLVPFVRDPQALEATLLSVLEVRSDDVELLIVHRGEYNDPYGLDGDEATLVETSAKATLAQQLNLATKAASGRIVQVLLPGTLLQPDWADGALEAFDDSDVDVVSLGIRSANQSETTYGFDAQALPHRRITSDPVAIAGPMLAGTMIRRSTLVHMNGWNEQIPSDLIDLELCLLATALKLNIGVVADVQLVHNEASASTLSAYESSKAIGMLACGYSEVADSSISLEPLGKRLGQLATGLLNPKIAAERLGWVLGVRDRTWVRPIAERIRVARSNLSSANLQVPYATPAASQTVRRAA